jgi:hypothetical protein
MGFLNDHPWGMNNCTFWGVAFCGVAGYTVGDAELVDFAIESPHGLKHQLEHMVRDHGLWAEAPAYDMFYVSSAMSALAEAAWHVDGTDLYRWRSPSGRSLKNVYDTCLALSFPMDLRVANWGDYSSQSARVSASARNTGHHVGDTFLINDRDGRDWNKFELAWLRYRDPAYAWVLTQNPRRDQYDQALWGQLALTHGAPLDDAPEPPDARSSILPDTGTAMLRAQEGRSYWTSPAPAAVLRFGPWVNHGHHDSFHLSFHGMGTLLYPDWFLQWDYSKRVGARNPTPWSKHSVAHNTVMVDRKNMPLPRPERPLRVLEHEFDDAVKVIRIGGALYEGVRQTRSLFLTREYLLDVFANVSEQEHTYDWLLRGLGELTIDEAAFTAYELGEDLGFGVIDAGVKDDPENRWILRGATARADGDWTAQWIQSSGVGVRCTMLAAPGTTICRGDTPEYINHYGFAAKPADGERRFIPMVVARRQGRRATYVALHVPFAGQENPTVTIRQETDGAGIRVITVNGPGWTDHILYAEDHSGEHQVTTAAGAFRFNGGYGYIRMRDQDVTGQGRFAAIDLARPEAGQSWPLTLNGRRVRASQHGRRVSWPTMTNTQEGQ